jgi:ABC-type antimicrobial peptide transport system permease subunit
MLAMSLQNLRRRKLRTVLTVLGVVIGTASIVVMVSLGIGLNELTVEQIASYGSLTSIAVYNYGMWDASDSKSEPTYMTDETIAQFMALPHVTFASPLLDVGVQMRQGNYQAWVSLQGVSREYMEDIPLGEGSLPDEGEPNLKLVVGNAVPLWFTDVKTGRGYWETGEPADVDFMGKPMFITFETGYSDDGTTTTKKYMVETAGMVEGGVNDYNRYTYGVYVEIEALKSMLKKIYRKTPIPGQPTTKKGKAYSYFIYNSATVMVDDMANVMDVQQQIRDMGFEASSNVEWLEQSKEQSNMVQAVLGGIGAVSLFVAAIGIANTMMMSIYERTKEIGIIKVLGCDMGAIRNMFLMESGFIGFFGGLVGLGLSEGISMLMNKVAPLSQAMGVSGDLSRIPLWLAGFSLAFAVFIGMAAGFFPSLRAMRLSPLAAIRNE